MDYIYCIKYTDSDAVRTNFQPFEDTDTTIFCNLDQRQRSSQQILDLVDYLQMHSSIKTSIRRYNSPNSFSSDIPLWIELANPKSFFDYLKDKFEGDDVMVIHDRPSNIIDIEKFCREQKWICTRRDNSIGSEASVILLYDLRDFDYECFTRARTQLIIVTIYGIRYLL